jgi:ParB/RepB/Spo0J family partition protein
MEKKIEHGQLKLKELQESKTNPRKHFDLAEMKDLTASVKEKGVIVSLLVRPLEGNGHYEIIAGARRFRAAGAAGLDEVPCTIRRDLDDKSVLEIQVIENLQRADVHPLDEAEGYLRLHKEHKLTVDELAAKVGKSKAYIYARMKLADLPKSAKEMFFDGKLDASRAILIARIPNRDLAEKAAEEIVKGHGGPLSYREALEHIERNYMLELKGAPFDTEDAKLCPSAGACTTCPKRTGNQKDLFPEAKRGDVCTDPGCYRQKEEAEWLKQTQRARDKGQQVLVKPIDNYGLPSGYKASDTKDYFGGKYKSYKEALGKDLPQVTLARRENGEVVELVKVSDLNAALKKRGIKTGYSGGSGSSSDDESRRRKALQFRRLVAPLAVSQVIEKASKRDGFDRQLWRIILDCIEERRCTMMPALHRHGLLAQPNIAEDKELEAALAKVGNDQLPLLALEMIISFEAAGHAYGSGYRDELRTACEEYGVNLKAIEVSVKKAKAQKPKGSKVGGISNGVKCKACGAAEGFSKYSKSEGLYCNRCKRRACGKCGCTEDRACEGGCSWAKDGDQCSVCAEKAPKIGSAEKKTRAAKPAKKDKVAGGGAPLQEGGE